MFMTLALWLVVRVSEPEVLSICDGGPDRLAYPANFRIASMTAAGCSSGMKWPESGIA